MVANSQIQPRLRQNTRKQSVSELFGPPERLGLGPIPGPFWTRFELRFGLNLEQIVNFRIYKFMNLLIYKTIISIQGIKS